MSLHAAKPNQELWKSSTRRGKRKQIKINHGIFDRERKDLAPKSSRHPSKARIANHAQDKDPKTEVITEASHTKTPKHKPTTTFKTKNKVDNPPIKFHPNDIPNRIEFVIQTAPNPDHPDDVLERATLGGQKKTDG
ncbi:hypothetical protein QCA50_005460 [Cerrena zonata]|uniref:Uncharacterized protein n=1 Tax=Cerrena zonata TaxID=2478898 RepID=A0AAW0GFC6_9APHY